LGAKGAHFRYSLSKLAQTTGRCDSHLSGKDSHRCKAIGQK
jgi:hypothetical protein